MKETSKIMRLSLLVIALLLFSCAKERPEELLQGQGENLNAISDYQGKIFEVETGEALGNSGTTHSEALTIEKNSKIINSFDLVELKVSHDLIKDIPFRGRKNFKYKIVFEINEQFLMVYKLAKKENLPSQELTYAKNYGDNLLAVPLVGYPVSLIKLENILDSNGDRTQKISEFATQELANATHFRFDLAARQIFESVTKQDVFPSDLFDGQWFYAATIVSANTKYSTNIGQNVGMDFEAKEVSRIQFIKSKDTLRAVNLNIDSNIDTSDDINFETALEIPVKWVDYRTVKSGKGNLLKEERLDDDKNDSKDWNKRKYIEIDFAKVKSLVTKKNSGKFYNLEISNDYISFTIYYPEEQNRIKYSLRRAGKALKGRIYRRNDRKLFGFFTTERLYIKNWKYYRVEKQEEQVFMNRFYPKDGKITYHFSSTTPKDMREAGRRSVKGWNDAFKKSGTGLEVVLDESKDVTLGDIRYNIINIIDTKDGSGLLGYGPSIVDSDSGEIISATSNIYANPFREGLIGTVRNYIKSELGLFNGKYLTTNINLKGKINTSNITSALENAKLMSQNSKRGEQELSKSLELFNNSIKHNSSDKNQSDLDIPAFGQKCSFEASHKDVVKKIKAQCNELKEYINELKAQNILHNNDELKYIERCAEKLLEDQVVATLVHEMGHNFGLRHNFAASSDPENFTYIEKNGKQIAVALTSSVMDYQTNDVDELFSPGNYDIAAIKFGYSNKVEKNDKTEFNLNIKKSVASQISLESLKKFKFCTDEDVGKKDPLCQRHDHGTNPKEIVQNLITEFNSILAVNGSRFDRAEGTFPSRFNMIIENRILIPLKVIYDQWRYYLMDFVTARKGYLHTYNEAQMNQVLEEMRLDKGRHGKRYAEYYEASNLAFQFLKELVFLPIKFCVVEKTENNKKITDAVEFELLRRDIFKESGTTISKCNDKASIDHLAKDNMTFVREVGEYNTDQMKILDIEGIDDTTIIDLGNGYYRKLINYEHVGLESVRNFAMTLLNIRVPLLELHARESFVPNFMDDPRYRSEIFNFLQSRILNGISEESLSPSKKPKIESTINDNASAVSSTTKERYFKKFQAEKDLLNGFMRAYVIGLAVPGKIEATMEKSKELGVLSTQDPKLIPQGHSVTTIGNEYFAAAPNRLMGKIIATRNQLLMFKSLSEKNLAIPKLKDIEELAAELKIPKLIDAEQMTFKDFMGIILGISDLVNKSSPELQIFLGKLFELELDYAKYLEQHQSELKEILAKSTKEVFGGMPNGDKILLALCLESLSKKYKDAYEQAVKLNQKLEDYRLQVLDYEAQLDLLSKIIISL